MSTLESQNTFLILHCQEAEERLARFRAQCNAALESREARVATMVGLRADRVAALAASAARNERYCVQGEFRRGNELGEAELEELREAIAQLHRQLGFDAASSRDTETMLSRIEKRMQELTEVLEKVAPHVLRQRTLEIESDRRNKERTERQIREKREQEEKTQKALAIAMMPIKARVGRPTVQRVIPTLGDSREKMEEAVRIREAQAAADEDLLGGEIWD
jgi:chromosome segregation ATPase